MAKRVDKQDSTMDISISQLVSDLPKKPAVPPRAARPSNPANDASVWEQVVVRSDDFAPAPPAPRASRRWILLALAGFFVAAGGAYALFRIPNADPPAASPARPREATAAPKAPPTPALAAAPVVDAAPVVAPAVVTPPVVAPETAMIATPDAISGVASPMLKTRPAKKTKPVKRVAGTKKAAITKKKRVAPAPKRATP